MSKETLKGRYAIITGSSRGLGYAIAEAYLKAGANVIITGTDEALLTHSQQTLKKAKAHKNQGLGYSVTNVQFDDDIDLLLKNALKVFPKIDIVVNNAGVYGPIGEFETNNWDDWVKSIEVNLLGTAYMCHQILPHMKKNGGGKIINLSGGGATKGTPNFSAYAASKAAIVRFTECLALETGKDHIDINAIAPGALNTRLLDQVIQEGVEKVGPERYTEALVQRKTGGDPLTKAADLAVFLGSPASDGITGKLISAQHDPWGTVEFKAENLTPQDYTLRRYTPPKKDLGF
jgi:Dehydrogenases with different specificities (related to short-chain alcohol dehydrogenases)